MKCLLAIEAGNYLVVPVLIDMSTSQEKKNQNQKLLLSATL